MQIIFEKLPQPEGLRIWTPQIPEHNGGSQHENVGLDFFSATDVVANYVDADTMHINNTGLNYFEAVIRTGIRLQLPPTYHMRMASRSGLAFKKNIFAFPGTIDNSYRGEILIKLYQITYGWEPFIITAGTKVAQGIVFQSLDYTISEGRVDEFTSRGSQGFGSSG